MFMRVYDGRPRKGPRVLPPLPRVDGHDLSLAVSLIEMASASGGSL